MTFALITHCDVTQKFLSHPLFTPPHYLVDDAVVVVVCISPPVKSISQSYSDSPRSQEHTAHVASSCTKST